MSIEAQIQEALERAGAAALGLGTMPVRHAIPPTGTIEDRVTKLELRLDALAQVFLLIGREMDDLVAKADRP